MNQSELLTNCVALSGLDLISNVSYPQEITDKDEEIKVLRDLVGMMKSVAENTIKSIHDSYENSLPINVSMVGGVSIQIGNISVQSSSEKLHHDSMVKFSGFNPSDLGFRIHRMKFDFDWKKGFCKIETEISPNKSGNPEEQNPNKFCFPTTNEIISA